MVTVFLVVNSFHAYPFCGIYTLYCSLPSHEKSAFLGVFFLVTKNCVKKFLFGFVYICLLVSKYKIVSYPLTLGFYDKQQKHITFLSTFPLSFQNDKQCKANLMPFCFLSFKPLITTCSLLISDFYFGRVLEHTIIG